MMVLPNPPTEQDALGVAMWLAVFDRWFAAMELEMRRDEVAAAHRWSKQRMVVGR